MLELQTTLDKAAAQQRESGVQLLTKEKKVVELKELVALVVEQLGKWEAENETLMVTALEAEHQFLDKDQKLAKVLNRIRAACCN